MAVHHRYFLSRKDDFLGNLYDFLVHDDAGIVHHQYFLSHENNFLGNIYHYLVLDVPGPVHHISGLIRKSDKINFDRY